MVALKFVFIKCVVVMDIHVDCLKFERNWNTLSARFDFYRANKNRNRSQYKYNDVCTIEKLK